MTKQDTTILMNLLTQYETVWLGPEVSYPGRHLDEEHANVERIRTLLRECETPFCNGALPGHITGSAFVISHDWQFVLLTLHGKLGKWLQLGGHSDDNPDTPGVAMREATEESGIPGLDWIKWKDGALVPFDVDVHDIPASTKMPRHEHHDVRFLIKAPPLAKHVISDESQDLRWFSITEARQVTHERSMTRQFDKWRWIADARRI